MPGIIYHHQKLEESNGITSSSEPPEETNPTITFISVFCSPEQRE
jgi:hypothetical protein